MQLTFREHLLHDDRSALERITRSSGFFEAGETELALEFFDHCRDHGSGAEHRFLFADLDGKMVGYSNYGRASYSGLSYYLHWIAVDDPFRGRGLGKKILTETEGIIRKAGGRKIFVETSSRSLYQATQIFYERAGYIQEGRLKDFYIIGDDQLIYSRIIADLELQEA